MGTFHRVRSKTQTEEVARLQRASGEIWGKAPRFWDRSAVGAYRNGLPQHQEGIEFETDAVPNPDYGFAVTFSDTTKGVWIDGDWAKIRATVTDIRYKS